MIASEQIKFPYRPRRSGARGTGSAVGTASTQLDRVAVEERALAVMRQLLGELGSRRAIEELDRCRTTVHLERDLGLGSLERVELMLRLDSAFNTHLPDQVVAEADTPDDLIEAILHQEPEGAENGGPSAVSRYRPALKTTPGPAPATSRDLLRELSSAETLLEVLRLRSRAEPKRVHIQLYEEDGKVRPITYGELLERAHAVANALVLEGLKPGRAVAIMLPTCAEFFPTFFGVLLAGGIPVPIYPPFRADRIEEYAARQSGILRNAEALFLVTFRQAESVARLLSPLVPSLRGVLNATRLAGANVAPKLASVPGVAGRPLEPAQEARGDDIAFLQYTSGSTGDPKGVVLTHANLLANIRAIIRGVDLRPDDVAVSWLPLYHDMGLIGMWFVPLYFGIPVAILSPLAFLSRPERWLWAMHDHRGSVTAAPNFAYELCVRKVADRDLQGLDLSSWRAAVNGAEPVNPGTLQRFAERFVHHRFRPEAIASVYGLAEASLCVSCPRLGSGAKVDRIQRAPFEQEGRAIPAEAGDAHAIEFVSAGVPLPGTEVRLVNSEGVDVGDRAEGRLWFRSPSATSGYYRNPEATREILRGNGWIDSGDLAYRTDDELYITGRAKDIIIKGGRNIYPHEVEEIAGRVAGVRTGCVVAFGIADPKTATERLVVAAELRDPAQRHRVAGELTQRITDSLGMPPDTVELLPPHAIPKTSSGKLRRSETKRLYLQGRLGKRILPAWLQVAKLALPGAGPWLATTARKAIRRTGEIAYGVYALSAFVALFLPLWLIVLLAPSRRFAAQVTHVGLRIILAVVGVRVGVEGREVLDQAGKSRPWIFAPNHASYLDIVALMAYLPADARFVAKGEVRSMPFIGTIARRIGHFTFDRNNPQARIEQAQQVDHALRHDVSVVIYPEGTFTPLPGIRPFLLGAFKAAVDTGRPVCPVAVRGAREILRDGTYLPKPGRIVLTFGPLLTPAAGGDWHELVRLRDATREILARNSGEPML